MARRTLAGLLGALALAWVTACTESSREAESLTSAGVTHLQQREFDRAIRDFDRALTLQPGLVVAWRNRGLAHRSKGDYERALADYEQALLFAPSDARIYMERGLVYLTMGDFNASIRDFERAIAFKPDLAVAMKHRGRAHFLLGNFAQSAADLQRGLSLDSTDAESVVWLHLARQRMGQDDEQDLEAHAATVDTTRWLGAVVRYFRGDLDSLQLRARTASADSVAQRDQWCAVSFYLGEAALLRRERTDATTRFTNMRADCPAHLIESRGATVELLRMGKAM
jgi:lipoprotein NlpI